MAVLFNSVGSGNDRLKFEVAFYREFCKKLAQNRKVIFLYNDPRFALEHPNIRAVKVKPLATNSIKSYFWFSAFLKKIIREYPISSVINLGIPPAKIPVSYSILEPQVLKKRGLSGYLLKKNVARASKFLVFSEKEQKSITGADVEIIQPVPFEAQALTIEEREKAKDDFANGSEYFLYNGYLENNAFLLRLLKAFSSFKKKQRSSMKLVLTGKKRDDFPALEKLISTFKFKADVVVYDEDSDLDLLRVLGGAYAIVLGSKIESHFSALVLAMQINVPAIVPSDTGLSELGDDTVLVYNYAHFEDLGLKLITMFQDEKKRSDLIRKGCERVNSWVFEGAV